MDDTIDTLQIKISEARKLLPEITIRAEDAVAWKAIILNIKEEEKYTIEQIGDLETETELLLCGLVTPEDYPKELQNRMQITKEQTDVLLEKMNEMIFKKIQAEMIKIQEAENEPDVPPPPYVNMPKPPVVATPAPTITPKPVAEAIPPATLPMTTPTPVVTPTQPITQSGILGSAGIEMINEPMVQTKVEAQPVSETSIKKDEVVMEKSGIDVIADAPSPAKNFIYTADSRAETISGIENPPKLPSSLSSIIGAKLQGTVVTPKTTSDQTISAPLSTPKPSVETTPSNHTDPYREPTE